MSPYCTGTALLHQDKETVRVTTLWWHKFGCQKLLRPLWAIALDTEQLLSQIQYRGLLKKMPFVYEPSHFNFVSQPLFLQLFSCTRGKLQTKSTSSKKSSYSDYSIFYNYKSIILLHLNYCFFCQSKHFWPSQGLSNVILAESRNIQDCSVS